MDLFEDQQAEAIAEAWGVSVELLNDTSWELEPLDGNDGEIYGFMVRFNEETDPEVLSKLGIGPGKLTRKVILNALDEPEYNRFDKVPERQRNGRRVYYIDEDRFTLSAFRRLSHARKIKAMVQWFHENYEDPVVRTPYESREGGYQWIWGGPYDASEEIGREFSNLVDDKTIEKAVTEVTRDGLFEWAPKERSGDYHHFDEPDDGIYSIDEPLPDISDFEDEDELEDDDLLDLPPGQAYMTDASGNFLTDANGRRLTVNRPRQAQQAEHLSVDRLRDQLLSRLDSLEDSLKNYQENLPPRNHNNPPELVEPDPISPLEIRIVIEAARDLKEEAQKSQPQAEILESRAAALRRVAGSILSWIGRKADAGIDSLIKWGAPLAGAWALSNPERIHAALVAVAETASTWAQILFSGGKP